MTKATQALITVITATIVAWRFAGYLVAAIYELGRTTGELYRRTHADISATVEASASPTPASAEPASAPKPAPKRRTQKAAGAAPAQPKPRPKRAARPAAAKTTKTGKPSTTPSPSEIITLHPVTEISA